MVVGTSLGSFCHLSSFMYREMFKKNWGMYMFFVIGGKCSKTIQKKYIVSHRPALLLPLMLLHQSISYLWVLEQRGIYIQPFIFIKLILSIETQRLFLVVGFFPLQIIVGIVEYF